MAQVALEKGAPVWQLPGVLTPSGIAPTVLSNQAQTPGAGTARGNRLVAPMAGTLSGVALFIPASAGNIDVAILDTTATTRNVLYTSGSFACPAASATAWNDLGLNPGLAVVAGQQFDVAITNNNAGFQIARLPISTAAGARLPNGWMLAGTTFGSPAQYLGWSAAVAVGAWGTTLSEAAMSGTAPIAIAVQLT